MLKGKNVVVTGGSRGIGKAIALACAENGANVAISYISSDAEALKVIESIEELGVKGIKVKGDISNSSQCKDFIKEVSEKLGSIDILINNAGITKDGLLMRMKESDFDRVIEVNLKSIFNTSKEVVGLMIKQKYGRIINISSVVGIAGNGGQVNYAASKAGVIGFTKSLAKEVGSRGITVNAVAPGFIESDMTGSLSDKIKEEMIKNIPLKSFGSGDDVANLVVYLASDKSRYITGQVINVDGGMLM